MKLGWVTEPLLPCEVAPVFESTRYTIPAGCESGRYVGFKLVLFRRRLIVELRRPLQSVANASA